MTQPTSSTTPIGLKAHAAVVVVVPPEAVPLVVVTTILAKLRRCTRLPPLVLLPLPLGALMVASCAVATIWLGAVPISHVTSTLAVAGCLLASTTATASAMPTIELPVLVLADAPTRLMWSWLLPLTHMSMAILICPQCTTHTPLRPVPSLFFLSLTVVSLSGLCTPR